MAITLTEAAATKVKEIIDQQVDGEKMNREKVYLRVGVRGGGCSGFQYGLDLIDEDVNDSYEQFDQHGVKLVIDPKSYLYLNGATIDYVETVMQSGFTFNNPNASSTCGCGSSFSA